MSNTTSTSTAAWCLRFLSGALKGRTITLKPGNNALGSAGGCEVMLPGGEVQPRHLLLTVGQLVVSVQKVSTGSARLNGEELQPQQRKSVLAGDILSIGQIDLELDRVYPESEHDEHMFAWSESAMADDMPASQRPLPPPKRPGLRIGAAGLLLAVAGLVAVAAWQGNRETRVEAETVNLREIEKILMTYPETEVVAGAGGQFTVKGYVESRLRKQALQDAMLPFGSRVVVMVHAAEDMVEQARRYASDPGIAVTYAGKGHLIVSGTSDDDTMRQKIRRLSEDLHPTVLVSDKVQYRPTSQREKQRQSQQEPDQDQQQVQPTAQWGAWQDQLPGRMVSITEDSSGLRYIQLSNGSRYYVGSRLKSGAEIADIENGGLTLEAAKPGVTK